VLAAVSQRDLKVEIGDVWWIPEELASYPEGKDRFCLIVALEMPAGERLPARAHYVAGSTSAGGGIKIVFAPGEANLRKRTHFRFWWSGDIGIPTLVTCGKFVGKLATERLGEIVAAIRASRRSVLKRLVGC
jgi:hypothetical protein